MKTRRSTDPSQLFFSVLETMLRYTNENLLSKKRLPNFNRNIRKIYLVTSERGEILTKKNVDSCVLRSRSSQARRRRDGGRWDVLLVADKRELQQGDCGLA